MKRLSILLSALILFAPKVFAYGPAGNYDPGLLNSQYMKELKVFERQKTEERRQKAKEQQQPQVFILETVGFENNKAFPSETLALLFSNKIGKEIKQEDIIEMKRTLTQYYQINGYISAMVSVSHKKLEEKSLTFSIQEGTKNSISIETE